MIWWKLARTAIKQHGVTMKRPIRTVVSTMLGIALVAALAVTVHSSSATAGTQPIFTVMNASETPPDGVYFRNSPHTADTNRITGLGVYSNEQVQLECYAFGDAVGRYNDLLWYYTLDVSRPTNNGAPNQGFLNAHYINDGQNANVVDAGVPTCVNNLPPASSPAPTPTVSLAQGPAAPAGYRYAISLTGFAANSSVSLNCFDSASPSGFYPFTLRTDGTGAASTASYCYSGDGPDHWVVAIGSVESNHVAWGSGSASSGGGGSSGTGGGSSSPTLPAGSTATVTLGQGAVAPSGYRYAIHLAGFGAYMAVSISCRDSTDPAGFYTFSLRTSSSGAASTGSYCYSGDGQDHWVVANGSVESNHVAWGTGTGGGAGTGSWKPPGDPNPPASALPSNVVDVVKADAGIYWRSGPDWNLSVQVVGKGVYTNDLISLTCYVEGGVTPWSSNPLWYQAKIYAGRGSGSGYVNDHFLKTSTNLPNQPVEGVEACEGGGGTSSSPAGDDTVVGAIDVGAPANNPHAWGSCTVQDFYGGSYGHVIVDYSHGRHIVRNGMLAGWIADGGGPGLGCPTDDEHSYSNGVRQDFDNGALYWVGGMVTAKLISWRDGFVPTWAGYVASSTAAVVRDHWFSRCR